MITSSLSVKTHLAGMTSFLLVAASLLGFSSSLMPTTAAASPSIDGTTTNVTTTTTAAEGTNATATTTNTTTIELSQEPFAIGHYRVVSEDLTDETQPQFTIEGNTTITLPNSTETIITQDTGEGTFSVLSGVMGGSLRGHLHMTTEDGSESATADFTEFSTFESSTGIGLAYFSTNSTDGRLAPLNNMIAVYLDEELPNEEVMVTFFEWKGGNGGASSVASSDNNSTVAVAGAAAGG